MLCIFRAKEFNETKKNEYLKEAKAPPLPAVLEFYNNLLPLGYKIVFISGTSESYREYRELNHEKSRLSYLGEALTQVSTFFPLLRLHLAG